MNYFLKAINFFVFCSGFSYCLTAYPLNTALIEQQASHSISELYHTLKNIPKQSMAARIDWFSAQFKGTPYILGSLGEGPSAQFDQFPTYRVDGFDCDTYVNTVLALAAADSFASFKKQLRLYRYKDGVISYINRNHFTSIDWNRNNQQLGLLKDITLKIKDQQHKTLAVFAKTTIDKPGWYAHKTLDTIRLENQDTHLQEKRLAQLKAKGSQLETTESKLPYIPLSAMFLSNNKPNLYVFSQIPHAAIVEIIRPNWDLRQQIGTSLDISHLGFAIWIKDTLYFRQASSELGGVVDVPLIDYLKKARLSPTIRGINIEVVGVSLRNIN